MTAATNGPGREPVAWASYNERGEMEGLYDAPCEGAVPLYAAPPAPAPAPDADGHTPVPARSVGLNRDWTVCADCGLIQPMRGFSKPCRGKTSVELRAAPPAPAPAPAPAPDADGVLRGLATVTHWAGCPGRFPDSEAQCMCHRKVACDARALIEQQARELAELRAIIDKQTESDCDKVMAMTDEQIAALAAVQGSSAEIYQLKGEVGILRALRTFADRRAERAEADLAAARECIAAADAYCAALDAANLTHVNVYGDLASDCPICQCRDAYDAARAAIKETK